MKTTDFLKSGDLVFDVGAHVGDKAVRFRQVGARVICFEPQPSCASTLRSRFVADDAVVVAGVGLSDREGTLDLMLCADASTLSTFSMAWKNGRFVGHSWDKLVEVSVITLDKAILEWGKPNYIKIDVEGYEKQVLLGLNSTVPYLSFEFTKEFMDDAQACVRRLGLLGFRGFNVAIGESQDFLLTEWVSSELLFKNLSIETDPLLWGDIYARCDP